MTAEYARIPGAQPSGGPRPSASPRRWAVRAAGALAAVVVMHYALLGFSGAHMRPTPVREAPDTDAIFAELVSDSSPEPPDSGPGTAAMADQAEHAGSVVDEGTEVLETEGGNSGQGDGKKQPVLSAETLAVLGSLTTGPYVKDVFPIRTMRAFLELAEREIALAGVDTCRDRLGAPLIRDWAQTGKAACQRPQREAELRSSISPASPDSESTAIQADAHAKRSEEIAARRERRGAEAQSAGPEEEERIPETHELPQGSITCFNPKDGRGSSWWAMGSYPCVSTGLQTSGNASRFATPLECTLPRSRDKYALANLLDDSEDVACEHWENTTTVLVHRRDEWNPFHVAEDLLTVLQNLLIVGAAEPSLAMDRVQLAFSDQYTIAGNHYAGVWDAIGAHSPRILDLDPYADKTCFRRLVHGTAHTAPSILTVIPVHRFAGCASAITWAGSHYLRYLMGYLPPGLEEARSAEVSESEAGSRGIEASDGEGSSERKVVRVLFLSRLKLDKWFFRTRQYSHWRGTRHIYNEPALLDHLADGLSSLCSGSRCAFERVDDEPDLWLAPGPTGDAGSAGGPIVRFSVLDPLLVPLRTQAAYLAHTDVVVGAHGGALALTLFQRPGAGAMVELQVDEIYERNYHFKNLCYQLGRRYQELLVENTVDPGPVWDAVREQVEALLPPA